MGRHWLVLGGTRSIEGGTAFCKIFSGTPHLTIFSAPKYAPQISCLAIFGIFGSIFEKKRQIKKWAYLIYRVFQKE